jgi:hypothetical protein
MRQNDVPEVGKGQIDVPVGVDTTEELRAEVHVVEVAVEEEKSSIRTRFDGEKEGRKQDVLDNLVPATLAQQQHRRENNRENPSVTVVLSFGSTYRALHTSNASFEETYLDSMRASSGFSMPPAAAAGASAAGVSGL